MTEAEQLVKRAYALRRQGDPVSALEEYRKACDAFGPDKRGRAHCLRHIGDLARNLELRDQARVALEEAEALYRGSVIDTLALANTLRLLGLLDGEEARWIEARALYERAASETGLDLSAAVAECNRHLTS